MKATHVRTSMDFWELRGTQEEGIGRCRGQCLFRCIGEKGRWVHTYLIGQESHRAMGGEGQTVEQGGSPSGLAHGDMQCQAGLVQSQEELVVPSWAVQYFPEGIDEPCVGILSAAHTAERSGWVGGHWGRGSTTLSGSGGGGGSRCSQKKNGKCKWREGRQRHSRGCRLGSRCR